MNALSCSEIVQSNAAFELGTSSTIELCFPRGGWLADSVSKPKGVLPLSVRRTTEKRVRNDSTKLGGSRVGHHPSKIHRGNEMD